MQLKIPFYFFQIKFNDQAYIVQNLNDIDFFGLVGSPDEWREQYEKEIEAFIRKPVNMPILTGEFTSYEHLELLDYTFNPTAFPQIEIRIPYIKAKITNKELLIIKIPQYGLEYIATQEDEIDQWLEQKLKAYINTKVKKNKKHIYYLMNYPNIAVGSSEIQITYDPNENFSYLEICNQYFSTPKVNQESIFEREELIEEISTALDNIHLGSVLIEGPSGSGKSMAIQHTLDSWKDKNPDIYIYSTSASNFIKKIQSKHFAWQSGIIELGQTLNNKPVIIYLQDLFSFFNIGKYENYNISVGAFLGPYIHRGDIQIITEVTEEERAKIEAINPNYLNYFQLVKPKRLQEKELDKLLQQKLEALHKKHSIRILPDVAHAALRLSQRFFPYQGIPKMPIKIIEDALFYYLSQGKIKEPITSLDETKLIHAFCAQNQINPTVLDPNDNNNEYARAFFDQRLFGQPKAISYIVDITRLIKTDLSRPEKPIANLLFVGSSGVGKTQLAKLLSEYLFVKKEQFIRFDMSEYSNYGDAQRLISTESSSRTSLVSVIRRYPFSLLLFDEIEKAHPDVFDLLLQILGAGRVSDDKGNTVNFCSALIIMTSNLGANNLFRNYIRMGDRSDDKHFEQNIFNQVSKKFRPEFINRIDSIIPFKPLDESISKLIVQKEIKDLKARLGFREGRLKLFPSPEAINHLVEQGYNKEFGARHIQRTIRDQLLIPLSEQVMDIPPNKSYDVRIKVKNSKLDFQIKKHNQVDQKYETIDFLGTLANELYRMFVYHYDIASAKIFMDLHAEIEGEAVLENYEEKKQVVQQVETLKDQLEFFEFQINQEMLSNKPNALTIEALMHSWLEQLGLLKQQIVSLMKPKLNTQYIYLIGGSTDFFASFYTKLAAGLNLNIDSTIALNKIKSNQFAEVAYSLDSKSVDQNQTESPSIIQLKFTGPLANLLLSKEGGYQSVILSSKKVTTTRVILSDDPITDHNTLQTLLSQKVSKIRRKISKRKWEDYAYKQQRNKGYNGLINFLIDFLPANTLDAIDQYFKSDSNQSNT